MIETLQYMLLQAAPPAGAPAQGGSLQIDSALDFALKGGWAMIPIALCSLVAVAIIAERIVVLRRRRVVPRAFVSKLGSLAHDRAKALELARGNSSPIARILETAVQHANEPRELLEKRVEEAGGREVVELRNHMRLLSALPQVSTMLGLLGTVFGMIKTFQAVAISSEALGKAELLARGIFEAWTCTAAGLLVAVPVLIMYHYLMGHIDSLVAEIDVTASKWIDQHIARPTPAAAHAIVEPRRPAPPAETAQVGVPAQAWR